MYPPPVTAAALDHQDVVNRLLAAVLLTRATLDKVRRAAALCPVEQPQAAADFTDAATALTRIRDTLLRAADTIGQAGTQHRQVQGQHRTNAE